MSFRYLYVPEIGDCILSEGLVKNFPVKAPSATVSHKGGSIVDAKSKNAGLVNKNTRKNENLYNSLVAISGRSE
jgi:hypothetical protein